jgi:hypothetical protein
LEAFHANPSTNTGLGYFSWLKTFHTSLLSL